MNQTYPGYQPSNSALDTNSKNEGKKTHVLMLAEGRLLFYAALKDWNLYLILIL